VSTILTTHFRLSSSSSPKTKDENEHISDVSYASVVWSILYAMGCTHPNIPYVINVVNMFIENHGKVH
jgi:ATP-binding cassette subfamily B (MDR/TAP) protein 1